MKDFLDWLDRRSSLLIGYIGSTAGAIALMDHDLVMRTLGPDAASWALLIAGVLGVLHGHTTNSETPK